MKQPKLDDESVATDAGKNYDVEIDRAAGTHGKPDARVKLSGEDKN